MLDEPKCVCIGGYFCRRMCAKLLTFYSPPIGAGSGRLGAGERGEEGGVGGGERERASRQALEDSSWYRFS